jgi:hypothetical protein
MDLLSHCRDVYKLSCKSMVVITGAEFAVVLMNACNHVCRYVTSVINRNILIITLANVIFSCQVHNIRFIRERESESIALKLKSTTEED